tara:strand:- start:4202 stop:5107 length:906 start_codon:yes stop_codon:yes gene_type:complete
MKNVLKFLGLFIIVLSMSSCEDSSDDLKYQPNVESGWVQFVEGSPATVGAFQGAQTDIEIDVNIQVPTTSKDLSIFYTMTPVSGDNPANYFSNDGTLVIPAGSTSHGGPDNNTGFDYNYLGNLVFHLSELDGVTLTEPMIFDVELTGTDSSQITAGLESEPQYPVVKRVVINPSLDVFIGTFSVDEQFIAGVNAPLGLSDFFGESYQVELERVEGDVTASQFVITNSDGFDTYFIDGAVLTFGLDGSLSFNDGNTDTGDPVVGLFAIHTIESSSYDYTNSVLTATGPLEGYGDYQFVLTLQ